MDKYGNAIASITNLATLEGGEKARAIDDYIAEVASDIYAALGKMHRSVHRRLLCQRAIQAARGQQNAAPQGPRPAGQEGWPPPRPAGG